MPVNIELTAPAKRRFFRRSQYRRSLPTSFDEVPEQRRLLLWRALLSAPGEAGRVRGLQVLLDVPRRIFLRLGPDHVAALLDALPWLLVKPDPVPALSMFRYGGRDYYFPSAYGMNLAAIEYPIADDAFVEHIQTGSADALLLLCGTLLREREPDEQHRILRGDERVPLMSRSQAVHRAGTFKKLPVEIRQAALLYFAGLKEFVHQHYGPVLFEPPEKDEQGNPLPSNTRPTLGWWTLYDSVAMDGPFGKLPEVYQTSFHQVCMHLVERIRQQKEAAIKAKMASQGFGE